MRLHVQENNILGCSESKRYALKRHWTEADTFRLTSLAHLYHLNGTPDFEAIQKKFKLYTTDEIKRQFNATCINAIWTNDAVSQLLKEAKKSYCDGAIMWEKFRGVEKYTLFQCKYKLAKLL